MVKVVIVSKLCLVKNSCISLNWVICVRCLGCNCVIYNF